MLPLLLALVLSTAPARQESERLELRATLDVAKEGEDTTALLPFGLELVREPGGWTAFLINDPERIEVPEVAWDGAELLLSMPHYDSRIRARRLPDTDGLVLDGTWEKVRGKGRVARMGFRAEPVDGTSTAGRPVDASGAAGRLPGGPPRDVGGRWAIDFASEDKTSVGVFEQDGRLLRGTVLTHTGDYRYLAGEVIGDRMTLSCFDGAHAFLFEATLDEAGTLAGTFRSGNWWKEDWTAVRDEDAALEDAFEQTSWTREASLADYAFPDLDGELRSLANPALAGKATLVQLFGSWCPNCHDETRFLVELHERYRSRGLVILGLGFELTGERERDTEQLRIFRDRYDIRYPLFLAGTSNKGEASAAFPAIDRLRSFPTTLFFGADGTLRALHSGFAGPATGDEHAKLRHHYERLIEDLLAEEPSEPTAVLERLVGTPWVQIDGGEVRFVRNADGDLEARATSLLSSTGMENGATFSVDVRGEQVWFAQRAWRYDARRDVLVDPLRFDARLFPLERFLARREELTGRSPEELVELAAAYGGEQALPALLLVLEGTSEADRARQAALATRLLDAEPVDARAAGTWLVGSAALSALAPRVVEQLEHPHAGLRRESVRAVLALREGARGLPASLEPLREDPDPIVRGLIEAARH